MEKGLTMDNTREKLIELVGQVQDCGCDVTDVVEMNYVENITIVDHLIANGVTVQKWIPVTERLPKNDYGKHWKERKHYLVSLAPSGLMCVAHYGYKEYDWWIDEHDCVLSATNFKEVTHWMEINNFPQPPKGE